MKIVLHAKFAPITFLFWHFLHIEKNHIKFAPSQVHFCVQSTCSYKGGVNLDIYTLMKYLLRFICGCPIKITFFRNVNFFLLKRTKERNLYTQNGVVAQIPLKIIKLNSLYCFYGIKTECYALIYLVGIMYNRGIYENLKLRDKDGI